MTHDFPHEERTRRGKPRRCTWCSEWIMTGDKYVTWGQIYDGMLGRLNMHPECETAYKESYHMEEFDPGEMERGVPWDAYVY